MKVQYLGHVMNRGHLELRKVQDRHGQIYGMANVRRPFVPSFAKIAKPLLSPLQHYPREMYRATLPLASGLPGPL